MGAVVLDSVRGRFVLKQRSRCSRRGLGIRRNCDERERCENRMDGSFVLSESDQPLPEVHVIRHGETAWTESRRHTGLTDIPLTERGERQARRFGEHLRDHKYGQVFASPLQRARRTCELAGFGAGAVVDPDLVEWNYGEYDGLTSAD